MKIERVNEKLDTAVSKGIATTLISGVLEGIKFMRDNQVPIQIALRIIKGQKFRRSTDWKH